MNRKMTLLAFAGWWVGRHASGSWGRFATCPPEGGCKPAPRPSLSKEARAMEPMPTAHSWKKWRRVRRSRGFSDVMARLLPGNHLVEVEYGASYRGPGGILPRGALLPQQAEKDVLLAGRRLAAQAQEEGVAEAPVVSGGALAQDARSQALGDLEEALVVEEGEGLQGRVGAIAPRASLGGVGGVEDDQVGVRRRAPQEGVHAAAVAVGPGASAPVAGDLRELVDPRRLRRVDAGSADLAVKQPAARQGHVADHLGVEAQPVLAGQEPVARVESAQVGPGPRGLAVRRRGGDEAVHGLHAPALADELRRQPVKQF